MGKMYLRLNKIIALLLFLSLVFSCKKESVDQNETTFPTPYNLVVPSGFPEPYLSYENPLTVEGISLGKMLYNDSILSSNGRSCSSCHNQALSYSVPLFSHSNGNQISVPPHVNLAFKKNYNWIGNEPYLDTLCIGDFEPEFFNTIEADLFSKLSKHHLYPDLFNKAFGIKNINTLTYKELKIKIAYAITQFIRTLVSSNSKYDKYKKGQANLTPDEFAGMYIFFTEKGDCFHCHANPLFTDNDFHNNGLADNFSGFNLGRYLYTKNNSDIGKFNTPTLRNIALTSPYMHDGRLKSLEEVVDFYNEGVKNSSTLDPILSTHKTNGKILNPIEKYQLIQFLYTLTDSSFIK